MVVFCLFWVEQIVYGTIDNGGSGSGAASAGNVIYGVPHELDEEDHSSSDEDRSPQVADAM